MSRAWVRYEMRTKFGSEGEGLLGKLRHRLEDSINIHYKEIVWVGYIWLKWGSVTDSL
jgi:hypothetical protein